MKKTIMRRILLSTLSLALALSPLGTLPTATAQTTPTTSSSSIVAPNLMVILGNSYSMNRTMGNITLPTTPNDKPIQANCPATYSSTSDYASAPVFSNDPGCGSTGTPFPDHQYGNLPTSKLYIAKDVLYQLLSSTNSNDINFGFATFRQAFGMQLSTTTLLTNTFWPNIYPQGGNQDNPLPGSLSSMTTQQLNDYGSNPDNFAWVSWWPSWDNNRGAPFAIGTSQPNNSQVLPFVATQGGLPLSVQYPQYLPGGQQSQKYQNNKDYGPYFYGSGGLDMGPPINSNPLSSDPHFALCRTYFNSQSNDWQGEYMANNPHGSPRMVVNAYPTLYSGNTLQFTRIGQTQYDANGNMPPSSWTESCSLPPNLRQVQQQFSLVSDQFKAPSSTSTPAYFSYIPSIYDNTSETPIGTFTGWSGAASYSQSDDSYTASYPSGPQSASLLGSYNKSGAPYMGAFVDLPNPHSGYVDQRGEIKNLVNPAYPQWDDSGLGYDRNAQTIVNNGAQQSISASSLRPSYDPNQEPVFDSLMDAAAYFKAYKQQDPEDGCRTNAVLLIYDGHEDARWTVDSSGNVIYADPAKAAQALAEQNVKTYVAIISSNPGDIGQANAIASAGGTSRAFQVSNANDLLNAISTVFVGLQGAVVSATPAVPGMVRSGANTYVATSNNNYGAMEGHLLAYGIQSDGTIAADPTFDAASPGKQPSRANNLADSLWSDTASASGQHNAQAWADLPASVFAASGSPDAATISAYTINPNDGNGQYLAGRKTGSLVGTITAKSNGPVLVTPPSNALLLNKSGYATYAKNNASRAPFVLWAADDGFLYASDAQAGTLNWAYMPSTLLGQLKNYATFESTQPMKGGYGVFDGIDQSGQWHSYVFAAAQSGATHFAIQLGANGDIDASTAVTLDNQPGATSPEAAPTVVWDQSGVAYMIYTTITTTNSGPQAQLNVMSSTGSKSSSVLGFIPSSPFAINPATNSLYVGGKDGKIYSLNTQSGFAASEIGRSATEIGTMPVTADPAQYVGYAQTSSGPYIWATGAQQIAVFSPSSTATTGWQMTWQTHAGGPSSNANGTFQTDPGVDGNGPQFLPLISTITDQAKVLNGTLIVPVTTSASSTTNSCGATGAYYYLYSLSDGLFPKDQFTGLNGLAIMQNLLIGAGTAFSPAISYDAASASYDIYGASQQNTNAQAAFNLVAKSRSRASSGIVGVKPLWIIQQ